MKKLDYELADDMRNEAYNALDKDNTRADIYFAIGRLYDALSYGKDMQSSRDTAIDAAIEVLTYNKERTNR